jgi:hypothetical protein
MELTTSEEVSVAARWYAEHQQDCPRPVVPFIRRTFDLTAKEAVDAIRAAQQLRSAA